jgi:O-acetyl-ADP-ribose deacetylase (regulator of RNase III)
VRVVVDDLAFFDGAAIARPATAELGATTPLMRRLEEAGGEALRAQLHVNEPLAVGSAVVTGAGALGVDFLIHAVVASETEPVSASSVRRATVSALQRAADWQMERVAFTPFGLGAGNLDAEDSAASMVESIVRHLAHAQYPSEVVIVVETPYEAEVFSARLAWASA